MSSFIRHRGTIIELSNENGKVKVEICNESACAGCHAGPACGFGKSKKKTIQACVPNGSQVAIGENVTLQLPVKSGFFAVFVIYVMPLILLFIPLMVLPTIMPEWAIGLICLSVIPMWYGVVYGCRKFFEQHSIITVEKIGV